MVALIFRLNFFYPQTNLRTIIVIFVILTFFLSLISFLQFTYSKDNKSSCNNSMTVILLIINLFTLAFMHLFSARETYSNNNNMYLFKCDII